LLSEGQRAGWRSNCFPAPENAACCCLFGSRIAIILSLEQQHILQVQMRPALRRQPFPPLGHLEQAFRLFRRRGGPAVTSNPAVLTGISEWRG
jgi:hypothetical protein